MEEQRQINLVPGSDAVEAVPLYSNHIGVSATRAEILLHFFYADPYKIQREMENSKADPVVVTAKTIAKIAVSSDTFNRFLQSLEIFGLQGKSDASSQESQEAKS